MTGGYTKGSTQINVANGSGFSPGDYVETRQENDPNVYSQGRETSWLSSYIHGQILKVTDVSGNTLMLNTPLYFTYNSTLGPQISKRSMIEGVGIEHLTIERDQPYGEDGGANIVLYIPWLSK